MYKTLLRASVVAAAWLATTLAATAQQPAKPGPTAAELKKNLATISEGDEESLGDLVEVTARQLVTFLKTHELSGAEASEMGLEPTAETGDAAHFKVYTIGYSSGGTRGTVHVPVFQWKNAAGKLFAYRAHEECEFTAVYKLNSPGRTLYLLLGQEEGNRNTTSSEAWVVELKGNYLVLDNAAFGKSYALVLSNLEMSFNKSKQLLTLDLTDHDASEEDDKILAQWGYHSKFPARPMTLFRRTYLPTEQHKKSAAKVLTLKYSDGHFVRNQ